MPHILSPKADRMQHVTHAAQPVISPGGVQAALPNHLGTDGKAEVQVALQKPQANLMSRLSGIQAKADDDAAAMLCPGWACVICNMHTAGQHAAVLKEMYHAKSVHTDIVTSLPNTTSQASAGSTRHPHLGTLRSTRHSTRGAVRAAQ